MKRKQKRGRMEKPQDLLLSQKKDRRLLAYVEDKNGRRSTQDRRESSVKAKYEELFQREAIRYCVDYEVKVFCDYGNRQESFFCRAVDISLTGILLKLPSEKEWVRLQEAERVRLHFEVKKGTMPEGYEMKVRLTAFPVRQESTKDGILCGLCFQETLSCLVQRKKDRYLQCLSGVLLVFVSMTVLLMRAESILYFRFHKGVYFYSIVTAVFLLSRYLFSMFYRAVPVDTAYTPGVSIIIPCFNEEEWIQETVLSCVNQTYPMDKLEVLVVDDCSTDKSPEKIKEIVKKIHEEDNQYDTKRRVRCLLRTENKGKREVLAVGCLAAKHELVVFVDSDSFLEPSAIRHLVQPFRDPKIGGVSGRTDVANTYTNALTKMQSVRYYIAFRVLKAAEACFDAVTCLSGPLSCYRREIVLENRQAWLEQKFLGQRATFGDDRSMTNFVLRRHRTGYQDTAVCHTIVPNQYRVFLKQQMRWKRSWLRESMVAASFMWKKEPFMAVSFYMGVLIPVAAPLVVLYNVLYIPLFHGIFPITFLLGLFLMALLMSLAQLFLRKSSTWIFGLLFCLYYEAVLLWQMPAAWVTFWKSTWGTRMTPQDVEEQRKKDRKRKRGKEKR